MTMYPDFLRHVFTHHSPQGDQPQRYERIRELGYRLARGLCELAPPCADLSAAIRKVREAVATGNAAIACARLEELPGLPAVIDPDEEIAHIAHEANRAICESVGDYSQLPWAETPADIRASTLAAVRECRADPNNDRLLAANIRRIRASSTSHERWLEHRRASGWVYGSVKDNDRKTNPAMTSFAELPVEQRAKAFVFVGIVRACVALERLGDG